MTDDIVKRLRTVDGLYEAPLMAKAADEIEKLRKENAELLATCQGWANTVSDFTRKRDAALERADAAVEALRASRENLARLLLEFDVMVEGKVINDVLGDIIFVEARDALAAIDAVLKQGDGNGS